MEKIANFVCAKAKFIILIVVVLNLTSLASFSRFGFDTDFLTFFSGDNPKAAEFDHLNEKYNSGDTISILVEQEGSLLDRENLEAVYQLEEDVRAIDGIALVQSFLPPEILIDGTPVPVDRQFIEDNYEALRDFIQEKYFLTDQFLAPDDRKGVLVASLELDAPAGDVVGSLKHIVENEDHLTLSLAGNEIIKDTIWGYLVRIITILMPCAILLVLLVFFSVLRSRLLTVMAFLPAAFAGLWTFGTVFWSGRGLDIVTVLSPLFIIVIGSAFGLHYVSHFLENYHKYPDRRQLTIETLRMVGTPIFLAAITTMAGFVSLTWAKVIPMREMGIFVTAGIAYACFIALFFVPAVLSKIPLPSKLPETRESRMARLVLAASRQRAAIVLVFVAIVIASAVYIPKLEVVSDQLMFFKEGSPIRVSSAKVEDYFGGASPLTAEIVSPNGFADLLDPDFAANVLSTERELENLPGMKSAFSVIDLIKGVNLMITGEDVYPQDPAAIQGLLTQMSGQDPTMWVSSDGMRMVIRTQDFESKDIDELEAFVADHSDTIRVVTGMPLLFDEMNRLVVESQFRSLGLALVLIFLMLLVTLRKIRAAVVGMLPITITIVAILGMISIAKFNLNIMTANLSAICIGVGVDYAVHLISGIYYFRRSGMDDAESVDAAVSSVSRPILANAFGLAIGLSVLFFSPIRLHFQAASIMWVAMIVSSMAALLLIPIFYTRRKRATTRSDQ